jgi:hypothetical protein
VTRLKRRKVFLPGYYAYDAGGEIVLDRCPSSQEHLVAPLPTGKEYRDCRVYLRDLLPAGCLQKRGDFMIEIRFISDENDPGNA